MKDRERGLAKWQLKNTWSQIPESTKEPVLRFMRSRKPLKVLTRKSDIG